MTEREIIADSGWHKVIDPETGDTFWQRNVTERIRVQGDSFLIPLPDGIRIKDQGVQE